MASLTQQPVAAAPADGGKGKKGKPKATKLNTEEFLSTNNFKMVDSSWADIMEDEDVIVPSHVSLPSAPKSTLGPEFDLSLIPNTGPFRVQVANLQYDVSEDQLADMFKALSVVSCRLHAENGRSQGTATVDFTTKQDLIDALEFNNRQLNNRAIRIFLPNQDRYGDRDGRRGGGGRGGSYVDNTPMNWRSATRPDAIYPPKSDKVFPPPNVGRDGMDRGGFGGGRDGPRRYGGGGGGGGSDDFSRPPRNDSYGGDRGYGGGGRREYGDEGGRRDDFGRGRRDRYGDEGGRSNSNWTRGPPRPEGDAADAEEPSAGGGGGWRRDGPRPELPASDSNFGSRQRDNRGYGGDRRRDDGGPPPSREPYGGRGDSFRNRHEDGAYEPPRRGGGDFERRERPSVDDYEQAPRGRAPGDEEYEAPRSFAPAPRERTLSSRSDRSSNEGNRSSHGEFAPIRQPRPQEERPPELKAQESRLKDLLSTEGGEEEAKPSSYSSIFGSAKPIDTRKREEEIEKRMEAERELKKQKEEAERAQKAAEAAAAAGSVEGDEAADGAPTAEGGSSDGGAVSESGAPAHSRGPRTGPPRDGTRMGRGPREPNDRNDRPRGPRQFGEDRNGYGRNDGPRRGDRDGGRIGGRGGGDRRGPRSDDAFDAPRRSYDAPRERREPGGGDYDAPARGPRFNNQGEGRQTTRNFYPRREGGGFGGHSDRGHHGYEPQEDAKAQSYIAPNRYGNLPEDNE